MFRDPGIRHPHRKQWETIPFGGQSHTQFHYGYASGCQYQEKPDSRHNKIDEYQSENENWSATIQEGSNVEESPNWEEDQIILWGEETI